MTAHPRAHARFPEPLQARVLAHLVRMAKLDKSYAWWAAKHYAALHPEELGEMLQMLTQAMRANASSPHQPCAECSDKDSYKGRNA